MPERSQDLKHLFIAYEVVTRTVVVLEKFHPTNQNHSSLIWFLITSVKTVHRLDTVSVNCLAVKSDSAMNNLALKIRLAILWLFIAVTMSANTILYFIVPGVIDEIRGGEVVGMQAGHELLLVMAMMYFWAPLVMAVLSLALKNKANQWANITLGVFYAGFILFELVMNIATVTYPYVILMDISAIVISTLIVWHARKLT